MTAFDESGKPFSTNHADALWRTSWSPHGFASATKSIAMVARWPRIGQTNERAFTLKGGIEERLHGGTGPKSRNSVALARYRGIPAAHAHAPDRRRSLCADKASSKSRWIAQGRAAGIPGGRVDRIPKRRPDVAGKASARSTRCDPAQCGGGFAPARHRSSSRKFQLDNAPDKR